MKIIDKDIKMLSIEEIFDLEYKIHKILSKIKNNPKKKDSIYHYKNILININNIKEEYDLTNIDLKLRYLKKEYIFLTKLNKLKLKNINFLKHKLFNKKISNKFIVKQPILPRLGKRISKKDLINLYEKNIEVLLKNKMIYDGKLYHLEHLYNKLVKKC